MTSAPQDKAKEIAFFDAVASEKAYDVFEPASSARIVETILALSHIEPGSRVLDIGCGSGDFTALLQDRGMNCFGLDLSHGLLRQAQRRDARIAWLMGDAETLPFADGTFDCVVLSGLVHHLPDPAACARETFRVLRRGGRFVAFDPNRRNPFMWLYRDRSSPFYSPVGVTENERPVIAAEVAANFVRAGFRVDTDYLAGLRYSYVESPLARRLLPIYHLLDDLISMPFFMRAFRTFVFTYGTKP